MPRRHGLVARATLGVTAVALSLLLLGTGCDREAKPAGRVSTQAEAGSVTHYAATGEAATGPATATKMATGSAPAPAAPKPTTLPAGASCVTAQCHASFASAKQIHGPVAAGSCSSCHRDDTGGHTFPLKRDLAETCTFCHAVVGGKAHQHEAIGKQGCVACHRPHTSDTKFLLTAQSVERVCAQCHDVPLKSHAHRPFAEGQCTLCHQPHQSDARALLRGGDGAEHCYSCHSEMREAMTKSSHVHKAAQQGCTNCHGPHATDFAQQLVKPVNETCFACHTELQQRVQQAKVPHGALMTPEGCTSCHDPHASNRAALLPKSMDQVCLKCHDEDLKSSADGHVVAGVKGALTAANLHGPVRAGDCTACHDVHGAQHANLLRQEFPKTFYASFDLGNYALCFNCHDKQLVLSEKTEHLTGFRDGDVNLHYVHVHREEKGRTCKTCHDVHGSNLPNHMASGVPFERSSWSMPIRYEKQADGGSCAPGCHEPQRYSRSKVVQAVPAATEPISRGDHEATERD